MNEPTFKEVQQYAAALPELSGIPLDTCTVPAFGVRIVIRIPWECDEKKEQGLRDAAHALEAELMSRDITSFVTQKSADRNDSGGLEVGIGESAPKDRHERLKEHFQKDHALRTEMKKQR